MKNILLKLVLWIIITLVFSILSIIIFYFQGNDAIRLYVLSFDIQDNNFKLNYIDFIYILLIFIFYLIFQFPNLITSLFIKSFRIFILIIIISNIFNIISSNLFQINWYEQIVYIKNKYIYYVFNYILIWIIVSIPSLIIDKFILKEK